MTRQDIEGAMGEAYKLWLAKLQDKTGITASEKCTAVIALGEYKSELMNVISKGGLIEC